MIWGAFADWLRAVGVSPPVALVSLSAAERLARTALAVAIEELGKGETEGNNRGADIRRYLAGFVDSKGRQVRDGGAWCGAFASFAYRTAGERSRLVVPFELHTGAKRLGRNMGAAGRLFTDPDDAQPGDLILFHRGPPGDWRGHVGIVERVERGIVHHIDGNKGAAGRARVARFATAIQGNADFWTFASVRSEPSPHPGPLLAA